eukprot:CAMPEP_0113576288 /NCGR_PEP_ID=MMETSP0015_2-20120614/28214_1 /TAXON_ID=2838 /ORGANISM="Odontella" /LENGTH=285 /DNA_ID=CAMNT_0000479709 /DNA_START=186 /DNA_END=1039 /DNA_ORIENTATION=- /assembly_acc=CAM_ASM_000160
MVIAGGQSARNDSKACKDGDKVKGNMKDTERDGTMQFVNLAKSVDGSCQFIGITSNGTAYTWGRGNGLGQLGRRGRPTRPAAVVLTAKTDGNGTVTTARAVRGYAGGSSESGHTAILDSEGSLWLTGCDRWQQLGFGSPRAGAAGYTWKDGVWQERFRRNDFLPELMSGGSIRDVALGGDHTIVLDGNGRDVYAFGKGGEGQLGLRGRPFVSTPARSTGLSSSSRTSNGANERIAAVCAIQHCSLTLDSRGNILRTVGRCKRLESSKGMAQALEACKERARRDGL